jgi:hypothetical protein
MVTFFSFTLLSLSFFCGEKRLLFIYPVMGDGKESEGPFSTTEPQNKAWPSLFILISRVMTNQHTK